MERIYSLERAVGARAGRDLERAAHRPVLDERYQKRGDSSGLAELGSYAEVAVNRTESEVSTLADDADVAINTEHCDRADVEIRAAAALRLPSRDERLVDVLVSGQYGSEGKGNIAYYLAGDYDLCVPRIPSTALTCRVALPVSGRDDHRSCACGSSSSWSRG
jgi:adenylosuccinate synthase